MTSRGTALVTGATSGIGLAAAAALTNDGWSVIATARNPESAPALAELADGRSDIAIRQLDVTSQDSVDHCISSVLTERGAIDLLLNNAGVGHRGTLEQLSDEQLAGSFEVNFWGVARTTRAVLPGMRERRGGHIITVTSTNAVVGMPFSDAYNAAKFAVEGLMEGLAAVLRHFDVFVSVLEPGPVRTAFLRNAHGETGSIAVGDPYSALLTRYNGVMSGMLSSGESPDDVAALIARIAGDPRPAFRYQSSDTARTIAARKFTDPTGNSVIDATSAFLNDTPAASAFGQPAPGPEVGTVGEGAGMSASPPPAAGIRTRSSRTATTS